MKFGVEVGACFLVTGAAADLLGGGGCGLASGVSLYGFNSPGFRDGAGETGFDSREGFLFGIGGAALRIIVFEDC
jgi:hypothetical protein